MEKRKAIFLDRDGTINVDKDYLYKIEDFEFENGAKEGLKILNDLGYELIVVTNQSGIARGYYTEEDVEKLHEFMINELLKIGVKIRYCYYCPHHPEKAIAKYNLNCSCRKPNPGMIYMGITDFNIDVAKSFMVGDKKSDVEAGRRAGIRSILITKSEYVESEEEKNFLKFNKLYEFAKYLEKKMKL